MAFQPLEPRAACKFYFTHAGVTRIIVMKVRGDPSMEWEVKGESAVCRDGEKRLRPRSPYC